MNMTSNTNSEKYGIEEAIKLLKQHIEDFIFREQEVVVCVTFDGNECRNSFCIEDYSIDTDCLYLSGCNYELHINLINEPQINYIVEDEKNFKFSFAGSEINMYFID